MFSAVIYLGVCKCVWGISSARWRHAPHAPRQRTPALPPDGLLSPRPGMGRPLATTLQLAPVNTSRGRRGRGTVPLPSPRESIRLIQSVSLETIETPFLSTLFFKNAISCVRVCNGGVPNLTQTGDPDPPVLRCHPSLLPPAARRKGWAGSTPTPSTTRPFMMPRCAYGGSGCSAEHESPSHLSLHPVAFFPRSYFFPFLNVFARFLS